MSNPYKLLRDLLPEAPLQVGTVSEVSNGVATITLPGGGVVKARGEGFAGQRVFVRNSLIESTAPNLPVEIIEI